MYLLEINFSDNQDGLTVICDIYGLRSYDCIAICKLFILFIFILFPARRRLRRVAWCLQAQDLKASHLSLSECCPAAGHFTLFRQKLSPLSQPAMRPVD